MDSKLVNQQVRAFITENFLYARPDFELGNADPLLGRGIVDSMGVMEIVVFIEEQFGLQVDDADITEENLGSLDAITAYVTSRSGAASEQRQIA